MPQHKTVATSSIAPNLKAVLMNLGLGDWPVYDKEVMIPSSLRSTKVWSMLKVPKKIDTSQYDYKIDSFDSKDVGRKVYELKQTLKPHIKAARQARDQHAIQRRRNANPPAPVVDLGSFYDKPVVPNSYREVPIQDARGNDLGFISYFVGNFQLMGVNNCIIYIVYDDNLVQARRACGNGVNPRATTYNFAGYNHLNQDTPDLLHYLAMDVRKLLPVIVDGRRMDSAEIRGPMYSVISELDEALAAENNIDITAKDQFRFVDCWHEANRLNANQVNIARQLPRLFEREVRMPGASCYKFYQLRGLKFSTFPREHIIGGRWLSIPTFVVDTGKNTPVFNPQNNDNLCFLYCIIAALFVNPFKSYEIPSWEKLMQNLHFKELNPKYVKGCPEFQGHSPYEIKKWIIEMLNQIKSYMEEHGFDLNDMYEVERILHIRIPVWGYDLFVKDHGVQDDELRYYKGRWYRLRNPELMEFNRLVVPLTLVSTDENDPARFVSNKQLASKKATSFSEVLTHDQITSINAVPIEETPINYDGPDVLLKDIAKQLPKLDEFSTTKRHFMLIKSLENVRFLDPNCKKRPAAICQLCFQRFEHQKNVDGAKKLLEEHQKKCIVTGCSHADYNARVKEICNRMEATGFQPTKTYDKQMKVIRRPFTKDEEGNSMPERCRFVGYADFESRMGEPSKEVKGAQADHIPAMISTVIVDQDTKQVAYHEVKTNIDSSGEEGNVKDFINDWLNRMEYNRMRLLEGVKDKYYTMVFLDKGKAYRRWKRTKKGELELTSEVPESDLSPDALAAMKAGRSDYEMVKYIAQGRNLQTKIDELIASAPLVYVKDMIGENCWHKKSADEVIHLIENCDFETIQQLAQESTNQIVKDWADKVMALKNMNGKIGLCTAEGCSNTTLELVLDHDHRTGLIRGVICKSCNRKRCVHSSMPVYFHNGSGYDFKLILEHINPDLLDLQSFISTSSESYMGFTYGKLHFRDSQKMINSSLASIAEMFINMGNKAKAFLHDTVPHTFNVMLQHFPQLGELPYKRAKEILGGKSSFPYAWFDDIKKVNFNGLPGFEEGKWNQNFEGNDDTSKREEKLKLYKELCQVYVDMKFKNFGEFADFYCLLDTTLLADCMSIFAQSVWTEYHCDIANHYSAAGMAFDTGTNAMEQLFKDQRGVYIKPPTWGAVVKSGKKEGEKRSMGAQLKLWKQHMDDQ